MDSSVKCLCCVEKLSQDGIYKMCNVHYEDAMKNYSIQYPRNYGEMINRMKRNEL